jgi:hypothetical protein
MTSTVGTGEQRMRGLHMTLTVGTGEQRMRPLKHEQELLST